jgi:16S rRNA (cytosine967-C5)-methyltransferase
MAISPARAAAFQILLRVEREDAYASELLHSSQCSELTPVDQRLTTELVMGVLRWRSWLDARIAEASSLALSRLDLEVLTALRMGLYQLSWLDRVPARAAIHESVELVKHSRKRSAAPFANAVLRSLAQTCASTRPRREDIFAAADADQIAIASAHPAWLVHRWAGQFGLELTCRVCAYDQEIPTTTIRLRAPGVEEELRASGIELERGIFLTHARRVASGDVTKTRAYAEGRIAIQDEASQLVAALVGVGKRILDCCAAPGGKTWAIADHNPDAEITAVELHPHRAELLRKRVTAQNVRVIAANIREFSVGELYERVLVDAPCSGTGTIARNPEIKWRLTPDDLVDLHDRQLAILQASMNQLAPGGRLIYSTCSLEPEEDENVMGAALRANPSFQLKDIHSSLESLLAEGELLPQDPASLIHGSYLRTVPGLHACDGFFVAVLERVK